MSATSLGESDRTEFDALSPEAKIRVNQICDAFEKCWNKSREVSLHDFLTTKALDACHAPRNENMDAVQELILLDIHYRQKHSIPFGIEDYRELIPLTERGSLERLIQSVGMDKTFAFDKPLEEQRIGDYIIREGVGSGGMGQVYRAEHVLMRRPVAIKVLINSMRHNINAQRRFEQEVRSVAKLNHPNIVAAFDARQENDMLYLVTEWIDGEDLGKRVARTGRLSIDQALEIIAKPLTVYDMPMIKA